MIMNLKERAQKLKSDIPALYLALKDKQTPMVAKVFLAITVGYALSPIDLIPDFIPVLGYLDDLILLPVLIAITIKLIPKDIIERNRKLAIDLWGNGKPKIWYCAIPIILIWVLLIGLLIKSSILYQHQPVAGLVGIGRLNGARALREIQDIRPLLSQF